MEGDTPCCSQRQGVAIWQWLGVCARSFRSPGRAVLQKESDTEKAETREKVEEDRKPQIEAAIVRIMKVWSSCVALLSGFCVLGAQLG